MRLFFILLFIPFLLVSAEIEKIIENMSLDEKIGQLFMAPLCPKRDVLHFDDINYLIKNYHIGSFIVKQSDPKSQIDALNYFQNLSELPLLISADAEWGLGMRMDNTISYPKNIYLSKIKEDEILYELGDEIARQLKLVGVHINLAPVVDVNDDIKTPSIGMRTFGSDVINISNKAKKVALGMEDNNVLSCMKHFPGYSDILVDPHLDLPSNDHDLNRLKSVDFIPYQNLIKEGVSCIMTAHIMLPKLDSVPATMSKFIIQDLLRGYLNFKGLIITDALNMKALTNLYSIEEIAINAHIAGNDILLYGDHINPNIDDIINNQIPRAFRAIKKDYLDKKKDRK
ncbi:MAG: Beta-hexosaminidase, partial [Candidatus Anoxychlamydiales bacterium]|nr:Beta-hexosaminidase [Candidatus Anoxychlamydiales bacterium]